MFLYTRPGKLAEAGVDAVDDFVLRQDLLKHAARLNHAVDALRRQLQGTRTSFNMDEFLALNCIF